MIAATCATIAAVLASAPGGSAIRLSGECPAIKITRTYEPAITIDAKGATVRGLVIRGGGVVWRGGTLRAPLGMDARAGDGYAAFVRFARNVTLQDVTFTEAKKALVVGESEDVKVQSSRFVGVREDGVIASSTKNLEVTRNDFRDFQPRPSTCTLATGIETGVRGRDCVARGGEWKDGNHADAVQLRNGIIGALIGWNRIEGEMQGIGQMESPTDAPLANVKIIGNRVRGSMPHSITLEACDGCTIIDNDVARTGKGRTVLRFRPEMTQACGNKVADGGLGRDRCPK